MRSLYETPGFPHKGWEYRYEEDLEDLIGECEICGNSIRYEHHIYHPEYGSITVGCNCCEKLMEPYAFQIAKEKDKAMKKASLERQRRLKKNGTD